MSMKSAMTKLKQQAAELALRAQQDADQAAAERQLLEQEYTALSAKLNEEQNTATNLEVKLATTQSALEKSDAIIE
jgi:hypothetical protein